MSTVAVLRTRFPRAAANLRRYPGAFGRGLDRIGALAWFMVVSVGQIGWALRRYRRETLRLIAEIGMGAGAMAVVGGTVAIVSFVNLGCCSLVSLQGFESLGYKSFAMILGLFVAIIIVRQ